MHAGSAEATAARDNTARAREVTMEICIMRFNATGDTDEELRRVLNAQADRLEAKSMCVGDIKPVLPRAAQPEVSP